MSVILYKCRTVRRRCFVKWGQTDCTPCRAFHGFPYKNRKTETQAQPPEVSEKPGNTWHTLNGVKLPSNRCTEICPARLTDILCESYLQKQQSPASSHSARPTHYTLTLFIFQVFSKNNLGENIRIFQPVFMYSAQKQHNLSKKSLIFLLKSRKKRLFINNLLKKQQIRGIIPYIIKRMIFDRPFSTRSGVYAHIRRI